MKKFKKRELIFAIYVVALVIIAIYCMLAKRFAGELHYTYANEYYAGGNLLVDAHVEDQKGNKKERGIKVTLRDSEGKRVKGVKGVGKTSKDDDVTISTSLPEDLSEGRYEVSVSTKGFYRQTIKENITISKNNNKNIIISTDKGIYKPGDTIKYSAMILNKNDNKPIVSDDILVNIYDGNENRVYSEETKSTDYGIVSGIFPLADEVNSGNYKLEIDIGNEKHEKVFVVNPYITPQFEVNISTDKDTYKVGEKVNFSIDAKYFFGEPVALAKIKGTIGDKTVEGYTDANGHYQTEYMAQKEGKVNSSFEIIDSSNYLIEEAKSINISNSKIKIELLPENGSIITKADNTVYLFAKDSNGNPIKTHNNITLGSVKKEVITDENGMGKFMITSDEAQNLNSYTKNSYYGNNYSSKSNDATIVFTINSKDMMSNEEVIDVPIAVSTNMKKYIITDKMIYDQGEDIAVTIKNNKYSTNNKICVLKNNEVINFSSSDDDEIIFNLGDASGIVDIVENNSDDYYGNSNVKRTIFIKPRNGLNINIAGVDKEYKPGDEIKLDLSTENSSGDRVDSNILISILDEAVLDVAENDLSIDNIKLALQDITLSEGVSAADLYTYVMQNKSDSALIGVLLKQDNNYNRIIDSYEYNIEKYELVLTIIVRIAIITVVVIIIFLILGKLKKLGKDPADVARGLFVYIAGMGLALDLINLFASDSYLDFNEVIIPILFIATGLYMLVLHRHREFLFDVIYKLFLAPIVVLLLNVILFFVAEDIIYDYDIQFLWVVLFEIILYFLIMLIAFKIKKKRLFEILKTFSISMIVAVIFYAIVCTLVKILGMDIEELIFPYEFEYFAIKASLLTAFSVFDFIVLYSPKLNKKKSYIENQKLVLNINSTILYGILIAVLVAIFIGVADIMTRTASIDVRNDTSTREMDITGSIPKSNSWSDSIFDESDVAGEASRSTLPGGAITFGEIKADMAGTGDFASDTTGAEKRSGILDGILDSFDDLSIKSNKVEDKKNDVVDHKKENVGTQEINANNNEKQEKVRNVFLESLAFIPDVIAENGKASPEIKLSDNITTWNIQVVGNTKEGDVGYATSSFKVFKEFFVNYTLPTNAVVTDKIKIPVTVYNYTEMAKTVSVNVVSNDWCTIGEYTNSVEVGPKATTLIYVPIEIKKAGNNTLRVESKSDGVSDIVEKNFTVKLNGVENQDVVSSGRITSDYFQDFTFDNKAIDGSKKVKAKLYASDMNIVVDNIENILKLPSGCFEQTSASLYPDILVLRYLNENNIDNPELKEKALDYIKKGYQKLLTYQVTGEKGGYSLYGRAPAETAITAFGLMEFKDLSTVYNVDDKVLDNMREFLFKQQRSDGTFKISSTYIGGTSRTDELSINAYVIWALSEAYPDDSRLDKSIEYLESQFKHINNSYTLALIANAFSNTKNNKTDEVLERLVNQVQSSNNAKSLKASSYDYYGSCGPNLDIQASALTAIALNKEGKDKAVTNDILNYIIQNRDTNGTWRTTQSTILALKAINDVNVNNKIDEQTVKILLNGEEQSLDIKKNSLSVYELKFDNAKDENHFEIKMNKGMISYEVVKEYCETYKDALERNSSKISINQDIEPMNGKVNDIITQKITVENKEASISNGLIKINTIQGCSVNEESLSKLVAEKKIEKYEYNYNTINLYVRDFNKGAKLDLDVKYRVNYPVKITGGIVKAYDYYNPDNCAITLPENINMEE